MCFVAASGFNHRSLWLPDAIRITAIGVMISNGAVAFALEHFHKMLKLRPATKTPMTAPATTSLG